MKDREYILKLTNKARQQPLGDIEASILHNKNLICELQDELDKYKQRVSELTSECLEVEKDMSKGYARINQLQDELKKYRWIPITERLPKETKEDLRPKFLVLTENGAAVQEWRHYGFGWDFDGYTGDVTHWMEVPELKSEEN